MANNCCNVLIITGEVDELEKFNAQAKSKKVGKSDLSLESLFPIPQELREIIALQEKGEYEKMVELKKKYGNQFDDWCEKNWGTRGICDVALEDSGNDTLSYRFDSAWMPPVYWLDVVSRDFPRLKFVLKYYSAESDFRGVAVAENGIITGPSRKVCLAFFSFEIFKLT